MLRYICLLALASLFCILPSCDDAPPKPVPPEKTEEEKLPPVTTTGQGTIGVLRNDTAMVAKDNWERPGSLYSSILYSAKAYPSLGTLKGNFSINLVNWKNKSSYEHLTLSSHTILDTGFFLFSNWHFNQDTSLYVREKNYWYSSPAPGVFSDTFYLEEGTILNQLHITRLDIQNRIISGEFEVELTNPKNQQKISFKKGRFDFYF